MPWHYRDSNSSSLPDPSHTYQTSGNFTAALTVTDNGCLTDTTSLAISVNPPANQAPTAVASATPTSGTAPLAVQFTGSSSSDPDGTLASFAWDFGDGNSSSLPDPSHTYQTSGNFTATLTVTDNGGLTDTASVTISVDISLSAGLMAEWRFDDGSGVTAADSSGNGNIGVLLNGPTWTAGIAGGGLSFDGVDDAVDVGNNASLNPANSLTLAVWVNPGNLTATQMVFSKYGAVIQYFIRFQSGGKLRFSLNAGGVVADLNSNGALTGNDCPRERPECPTAPSRA